MSRTTLSLLALVGLTVTGCTPDKGDDSGTETDTGGQINGGDDTSSGGDDTGTEDAVNGTISGSVTVQLYTHDDDGEIVYISEDDAYGAAAAFPYGKIFVGAYKPLNDREDYKGDAYILSPDWGPNEYSMDVSMDEAQNLRVYASLDIWDDGVIQSWDPIGVYPDQILVEDGTEAGQVDITVLVDYDEWACGSCTGKYGPTHGGGGTCDTVGLDGPVQIKLPYTTGNAMAMLTTTSGDGPYYWDWLTPSATADGGEGVYDMNLCQNLGEWNLIGAWDNNFNGMIDPADAWGAYTSEPEVEGNPIAISTLDLTDYTIEIPVELGTGINIVPFVQLSGTVSLQSGATFDTDLPSGTTVYVAALRYRPTADLSVTSLEANAYDYSTFEWADLQGQTSLDWDVGVPANSVVYLWAYADHDGDEVLNESGDWVASGGDDNGRVDVGTSSSSHSLPLAQAEE